jgi:two-component system phosphate regulon response regulator PhoB
MNAIGKGKKILLVDDEQDVTELLSFNLERQGYVVQAIHNPLQIMPIARSFHPDMFILDVMMPDLSGTQICRLLRTDPDFKHTAIIFLTARGETEDRIVGLESGGDDYLAKPFDVRELLLRIQRLFARAGTEGREDSRIGLLRAGHIVLDEERYMVTIHQQEIELTATEFRLLKLLIERKGRVQTRESLLASVWNYETEIETRTVDTHIRRLREKLGKEADRIETIRGVGYRIMA